MGHNLPEWDVELAAALRMADLRKKIDEWIRSSHLRDLAVVFGGRPPDGETEDLLAWYDELSAAKWDFRGGKERNLAEHPSLTAQEDVSARLAAEALGLSTPDIPSRKKYDYCLILGGLVRACVTRPRYAAELARLGKTFKQVVALGGFRPLGGNEINLAMRLDVDATNEFAAMDAGVRRAFEIKDSPEVTTGDGSAGNTDWRIHNYPNEGCAVIAAPSSEPDVRRANSADTFRWWASRTPNLAGSHILLVTNPIYVPYQGAFATQILGMDYGVQVETVGISADAADLGGDTQTFDAPNYLQEIRSAIRGMRSLYNASQS